MANDDQLPYERTDHPYRVVWTGPIADEDETPYEGMKLVMEMSDPDRDWYFTAARAYPDPLFAQAVVLAHEGNTHEQAAEAMRCPPAEIDHAIERFYKRMDADPLCGTKLRRPLQGEPKDQLWVTPEGRKIETTYEAMQRNMMEHERGRNVLYRAIRTYPDPLVAQAVVLADQSYTHEDAAVAMRCTPEEIETALDRFFDQAVNLGFITRVRFVD